MGLPKDELVKSVDAAEEEIKAIRDKLGELSIDSAEISMNSDGSILSRPRPVIKSFTISDKAIKQIAQADPENIQEVAASQLEIINNYYQSVLQQAKQSFRWALVAAGVGLLFFLAAVSFMLFLQAESVSNVSLVSGALVEVIAGVNFYLYGRAAKQLASFHTRLDRTQRFLLANSVCENLEGEAKQVTRSDLVRAIFNGPTEDIIE